VKSIAVLLYAFIFACCTINGVAASQYKVMIVTWRGCEDACHGFQKYLINRSVDVEFIMRDANRRKNSIDGFLSEARALKVDLILTWGTSVTSKILGMIGDRDNPAYNNTIPTVFTIVADPVGTGIVKSLKSTGRPNVTGTYNRVPEAVNIETILTYMPEFKRLGMIYNVNEKNSILKRNEVDKLAHSMEFELVSKQLPLDADGEPDIQSIGPAVEELKAAGVDFIYLGSSSFLRDHAGILTKASMQNGLPVLSPYEDNVRSSDALISVAARYHDVGQLAGRQAEKILVEGVEPGDLPVALMTNFAIVINLAVAKKLQRLPPLSLLQIAEIVN